MNDYALIIARTILLYIILLVVFRLMGKREVGELSIVDLAIFVLMAEVAAFALDDTHAHFGKAVLPIGILFLIQYLNSLLILKNKRIRDFIEGDPTMIIRDGWILEKEMRKQRYNLDDLLQQLREQGVASVQEVAYAFLEQSGKLSIYKREDNAHPQLILPLILDGYVDERHLKILNRDRKWLEQELLVLGYPDLKEIFFCSYEREKWFVQLRARKD
ncbi:hypothetical protein DCE79_12460 [Lysinibacillus sp. 2017]|uniref:DUF421 domain-containing protein n=1 Tax=unclassified Lysinibacillus TaxID=2636778 RepID=UPI000D529A61|nr:MULTISPECIES: DUF421 domain-containing protein [unclassified Lysinibacillus]AWE08154.1 hypothetical protein DCE79_12460 [Lysinibacillus sp. 2017]TGN36341.1 DUF421 domain-containing protein [Lysinibacillus sp. S2017]